MKIFEFHLRITKIMKIIKLKLRINQNNENHRILRENHERYVKKHRIPCENLENHENHGIPFENN